MYETYVMSHTPMFKTVEQYVEAKIKILKRDFRVNPTDEEINHLYTLKTQTAIDNACHSIRDRHWYR